MKKEIYISHYDYDRVKGYFVRVPNGETLACKFFNKNKYGGMLAAKSAAISFRNKILKKNKQTELLRSYALRRRPFRKHSKFSELSPIIGINLGWAKRDKFGEKRWGWTARYMKDDKQKVRYFSVEKWGYKKAFKMACEVRFENCGTLYVKQKQHIPCKLPVPFIEISQ